MSANLRPGTTMYRIAELERRVAELERVCPGIVVDAEIAGDDGPPLDPDCRDGKHSSCLGGPCQCSCHQSSSA